MGSREYTKAAGLWTAMMEACVASRCPQPCSSNSSMLQGRCVAMPVMLRLLYLLGEEEGDMPANPQEGAMAAKHLPR